MDGKYKLTKQNNSALPLIIESSDNINGVKCRGDLSVTGSAAVAGTLTIAGNATFNGDISGDDGTSISNIYALYTDFVVHDGDTNTQLAFGNDTVKLLAGNATGVYCTATGVSFGTTTQTYRFDVLENYADYMARFRNDGNNDDREGMRIQCGLDTNPGNNMAFIAFADGNGTSLAYITGLGNGNCRFTGQAASVASDIRNKRDLVPMASSSRGAQSIINDIDIFEYRYKSYDWMSASEKSKVDSEVRIGVSAQAIASSSLAYSVQDNEELNQKDEVTQPGEYGFMYDEVDYREMVPILIQTSKEQFAKIQDLEARIIALENA